MEQTDKLVMIVRPCMYPAGISIGFDINRNLSPRQNIRLHYGDDNRKRNEEYLAALDDTHAQMLRDSMEQTKDLDTINLSIGVEFRDSHIELSIGRAYDEIAFSKRVVNIIARIVDPQNELGDPEIIIDGPHIYQPRHMDLDGLTEIFFETITESAPPSNDGADQEPTDDAGSMSDKTM